MPWISRAHRFALAAASVTALAALGGSPAAAQPSNDACANATPVALGSTALGSAVGATAGGQSACAAEPAPDVFHSFTTSVAGIYTLSLCGQTAWDTVLSLHTGCPADLSTEFACDDEGCRPSGSTLFGFPSVLRVYLPGSTTYVVRIAAYDMGTNVGDYALTITPPAPLAGACCLGPLCIVQTPVACATLGGTYAGDLIACQLPAGMPSTFTGVGGAIPDNSSTGLVRTINVPDTFVVGDVRVTLALTHGFIGDLTIQLTHGSTTVTLADHVGLGVLGSDATLNGEYVFADAAQQTLWAAAPLSSNGVLVPPGVYRASDAGAATIGLNHAFVGQSASGPWTLRVIDAAPGFAGTLAGWSLVLDAAGPSTCPTPSGACCVGTACSALGAAACASAGGTFRGVGSTCSIGAGNPIACCIANFDQAGGVQPSDIFAFLNAWFASDNRADIDGGGLAPSDIFAFLNAWFAGC